MAKAIAFGALLLGVAIACSASAVLIDVGSGNGNTGTPFEWEPLVRVGARGGTSAIYLGWGAVITASHVGAGPVAFDGTVYPAVPGSAVQLLNPDDSAADLILFAIHPRPALPPIAIASQPPPYLGSIVIAGNGLDRGYATSFDPNGSSPPGPVSGFTWAGSQHLRYGTNRVEAYPAGGRMFNTQAFGSLFDSDAPGPEGQAVPGDSGGAAFWQAPSGQWQLAGVILAILQYPNQPPGTTFFGQTTYYADLSYYRDQIEEQIALPEPIGALAPCTALVAALAARRRRKEADSTEAGRRAASRRRAKAHLTSLCACARRRP